MKVTACKNKCRKLTTDVSYMGPRDPRMSSCQARVYEPSSSGRWNFTVFYHCIFDRYLLINGFTMSLAIIGNKVKGTFS